MYGRRFPFRCVARLQGAPEKAPGRVFVLSRGRRTATSFLLASKSARTAARVARMALDARVDSSSRNETRRVRKNGSEGPSDRTRTRSLSNPEGDPLRVDAWVRKGCDFGFERDWVSGRKGMEKGNGWDARGEGMAARTCVAHVSTPRHVRRTRLRCRALFEGKEVLRTYRRRLGNGDIAVREIRNEEAETVAELLTEVFAEEMGTTYRPYILKQVGNYLREKVEASPDVVCLVAVEVEVGTGREAVVGTAELSFNAATRSVYNLQPPEEHAYMCNLAVSDKHRRKGCGSLLLSSCEELASLFGKEELYVHVRLVDEPARKMYRKTGYDTWKIEGPMMSIGRRRRALLRKKLTSG